MPFLAPSPFSSLGPLPDLGSAACRPFSPPFFLPFLRSPSFTPVPPGTQILCLSFPSLPSGPSIGFGKKKDSFYFLSLHFHLPLVYRCITWACFSSLPWVFFGSSPFALLGQNQKKKPRLSNIP